MKILVTGAGGFLGSAAVKALVATERHSVVSHYRSNQNASPQDSVYGDLKDGIKIPAGVDAVIHCAGLAHQPYGTPRDRFHENNVLGTKLLAQKAKVSGVKQFVLISSVSVYKQAAYGAVKDENFDVEPEADYGKSKLESEEVCKNTFAGTKTQLVIVRPSTIVGEGDRANMYRLISSIDSGRFVKIGKGKNRKSFVYIEDAAEYLVQIIESSTAFEGVINLSAPPIEIRDVLSTIYEGLGKKQSKISMSPGLALGLSSLLAKLVPIKKTAGLKDTIAKWLSDDSIVSTMASKPGWPSVTAIEAIRREVEWFKKQK